jgi:hypothetical protein
VWANWLTKTCRSEPTGLAVLFKSAIPAMEEKSVRKRSVFAAFCILALPLLYASSQSEKLISSTPFAFVAVAGHVIPGGRLCACETGDCACEEGEIPIDQNVGLVSDQVGASSRQGASPIRANRAYEFDFGSSAMVLALAFLVWSRLRA